MTFRTLVFTVALLSVPQLASAKSARCFTTDDGHYPCNFRGTGGGSFEISAPGKPSFRLTIDAPGEGQASGISDRGAGCRCPDPISAAGTTAPAGSAVPPRPGSARGDVRGWDVEDGGGVLA